jgi:hypothetical protein
VASRLPHYRAMSLDAGELGAITTFDELTNPEAPGVDEVFDDMMRRLERGQ